MQYSKTIVERFFERTIAYRKELMLAAALVAVSGTAVVGYFWYKDYVARQGHKAYAGALQLLQARILKDGEIPGQFETVFVSSAEKWTAVAGAFGKVYQDFGHVGIGVMAGAARVQALLRLGETTQARELLKDVVLHITSPELRSLYSLLYARLLIESADAGEVQQGVGLLSQLAATKDSAVHDSALYYLGLHYWFTRDFTLASNYWQQLATQYDGLEQKSSPWLGKVKEKLALLQGSAEGV